MKEGIKRFVLSNLRDLRALRGKKQSNKTMNLTEQVILSLGIPEEEVKSLKQVYKGIDEDDVIRLERQIGLPMGTKILVMVKTFCMDEQKK
ncbi:MAG: hypothetical protein AB1422_08710 [bacterium]